MIHEHHIYAEPTGDRLRFANWDPTLVTPTLVQAPTALGGSASPMSGPVQPHHGLIGLVVLAALVLIVLDRVGFRFAVTAGRR